jgi:RNA-directed DNA polymerase
MVAGDRADAERLRDTAATVLLPMGLRLSEEKTKIVHIDEGFDFLGCASSVTGSEGRSSASSTPTLPGPHWLR